jgi:outer membrane receptor for ferrienterochelin and colicins
MKKVLLIGLFLSVACLQAQNLTVLNGETKEVLAGATLALNPGTEQAIYLSSDKGGKLKLKESYFKEHKQLIIKVSFIGFESQRDTLTKGESVTIYLKPRSYQVNNVVVTAQYSPTTLEKSVHKVKVISRQKIENMAAVNLEDVLNNELNVRISQDNILGSGMSLQGISGQNVKILLDGVPVIGRLDGQIDLNQINLNDIERIEIVEGPLSVNYGSNALAGTINIITKKESKEKLSVGLQSYTENIGKYNLTGNVSWKLKKQHSFYVAGGRNYFDGWSLGEDFFPSFSAQKADSGRVQQWNPKEQYFGRLRYNYSLKNILLSYKGEFFNEKITNLGYPRRTATSYVAFDDYYYTQRFDNALFAQGKLSDNWSINWTTAYNDFQRVKEARRKDLTSLQSDRRPETANNDLQDTSNFHLWMSRGSIASTRDSAMFNYEIGYDINLEKAVGKRIEGREKELADYAFFASSELKLGEHLVAKPGLRYAYNTKYDAPLTPSINLRYSLRNSTLRFSYAKGFRAPSLKELYFNFDDINHSLFGNRELKAERSNNYTLSIQQKWMLGESLLKLEGSLFYNQLYNQISFAQTNTTGGDTLVYFNVGENETRGVNIASSLLKEQFQFHWGASYTGRYNQLSEESSVESFSYSMELVSNASYHFTRQDLTIAAFFKHQGELPGFRRNTDNEIVKQTIAAYHLLDATISKGFWEERFSLSIGVKNIFDVKNVKASLSSGAHSSGGNSISIGTGRTVFFKMNWQLTKNK